MKQETILYLNMVDIVDFIKLSSLVRLPAGYVTSYILTFGLLRKAEAIAQRYSICLPLGLSGSESAIRRFGK